MIIKSFLRFPKDRKYSVTLNRAGKYFYIKWFNSFDVDCCGWGSIPVLTDKARALVIIKKLSPAVKKLKQISSGSSELDKHLLDDGSQ